MNVKPSIRTFHQSPWFAAFILLLVFLAVTGYKYGWDDQHLEVPLLKHLIDDTLYEGDYYVESLQENFISYFYPILARLISVEQIPGVFFFLYLLSRFFLFFFIYKLWLYISEDRFKAFLSVLVFILMSRVDEFLYRTFSHQEFALAIIFAGIYFFFKERFYLAALILGLTANFHLLYSAFPMFFMGLYLLIFVRKHSFKTLVGTSSIFLIGALPVIVWLYQHRFAAGDAHPAGFFDQWIKLYTLACPQNFMLPLVPFSRFMENLPTFLQTIQIYALLVVLFLLNISFNSRFQKNKKALIFCVGGFLLLILCFIFTYIRPTRFFLDLNLTRNTQFLNFLLMGFTTILLADLVDKKKILLCFVLGVLFTFLKYGFLTETCSVLIILLVLSIDALLKKDKSIGRNLLISLCAVAILGLSYCIFHQFNITPYRFFIRFNLLLILGLLITLFLLLLGPLKNRSNIWWKRLFLIIPITVFFYQYSYYHMHRIEVEQNSLGFWKLQRNWEDMQHYVKEHTDKDAVIFVPYNMEMGGFRIHSDRKIVASYRDCGIIGFDYGAALEWKKRIEDIEPFKFRPSGSLGAAVQNAILKYQADYIVFMRYGSPGDNVPALKKMYTNEVYELYEVVPRSKFR